MMGKPLDFIKRQRAASPSPVETVRVLLVEDNPEVVGVVRRMLGTYRRVNFVVESVASTEALRDELAKRAIRDELTGLYSKLYFVEALGNEARRVRRHGRALSCLMLDLDDFKLINEVHGHEVADAALKRIAALIQDAVRDEDVVARCGEDEFCVLLIETPLNSAMTVAERVRFELAAQPIVVGGQPLTVTASIGVCAVSRRHDHQPDTVFDRASAALRQAKAAGKNQVSAYLPSHEAAIAKLKAESLELDEEPGRNNRHR